MLRPIVSSSVFDLSQCPDRFEPGFYSFGRASLLRQDMRVSRKQIDLIVAESHVDVVQVRPQSTLFFLEGSEALSSLQSLTFTLSTRLERISSASSVALR